MLVEVSWVRSSTIPRMSRLSEGPNGAVPQSSRTSKRTLDSLFRSLVQDPSPRAMAKSDSRAALCSTAR